MKKLLALIILLITTFIRLAHANDTVSKQSMIKLNINGSNIKLVSIGGMKTISTYYSMMYFTKNSKPITLGPIYNAINTQSINNVNNQLLIKKINELEKEMIIYKAAQEKYVITVFTDTACSYCHKLHEQIKDYNALGITVRYLAFPSTGIKSKIEQDMKAIWCAKNSNKAFDDAMKGKNIQLASCDIDITNHYTLGVQFGVTGTPAIVLNNGYMVLGYQEPKEMKFFLDTH